MRTGLRGAVVVGQARRASARAVSALGAGVGAGIGTAVGAGGSHGVGAGVAQLLASETQAIERDENAERNHNVVSHIEAVRGERHSKTARGSC